MRRLLIVATMLAMPTLAAAQNGPAQTPAALAEARAKLLAADTDHDGKWSKAEWLAAGRRERGFDFMDADKNGSVTPAELQSGLERAKSLGFGK